MRGKRTDIETKAKIIEAKINTDWSSRDIEETTWIPHETIAKVLREDFAQVCTHNEKISDLVIRNNNLQSSADALIAEMIASKDDSITIAQLTSLRESTFKQNQLISGKPTDRIDIWVMKELTTSELLAMTDIL